MKQQGSVLLMTLIFISLTAMLCMSLLEGSLLARQLLFQQQQKSQALLLAENALSQVIADNQLHFRIPQTAGYISCDEALDAECDDYSLTFSIQLLEGEKLHITATAQKGSNVDQQFWEIYIHYQAGSVIEIYAGIELYQRNRHALSHYRDAETEWFFF